jgi:hypothetical protein
MIEASIFRLLEFQKFFLTQRALRMRKERKDLVEFLSVASLLFGKEESDCAVVTVKMSFASANFAYPLRPLR